MHAHLRDVLARLDRTRGALRQAIDAIPPSQQRQRPAPERWSAAEIIEHLTLVERLFSGRIATAIDAARTSLAAETGARVALPEAIEQRMGDRVNKRNAPDAALPTGTVDIAAGWAALESGHQSLRALVTALDGLALGEVILDHPAFGSLNVYQWIELMAAHEARHMLQVRELAAAGLPDEV
jgi:hypothetical protein